MIAPDTYQQLNKTSKLHVELNIEDVAEKIHNMNYGVHRFLSAFVRIRLGRCPDDELGLAILDLLNKGMC